MRLIDLAQTHARGEPARTDFRFDVFISKPTLKALETPGRPFLHNVRSPTAAIAPAMRETGSPALECVIASASGGAGGAGRSRTDDLMLAKHALYQLSYGPLAFRRNRSASVVVGPGGLEPPTSRLSGVCSNQLSYRPETITPRPLEPPMGRGRGGREGDTEAAASPHPKERKEPAEMFFERSRRSVRIVEPHP